MAWRNERRHLPRIEHGQLLAGGLLSGPSAASDALHGSVSPYPGVYSRCIPVWDRPRVHRPGRVCQKERRPIAVVCDAVLVFVAARALRPRVRSSHALLLVQWRLVAIWVSRAHVSARKPSFPWRSRMSRISSRRIEHLGVARMSRGRGTGRCGLTPPLSPLKRTEGAPPYELA